MRPRRIIQGAKQSLECGKRTLVMGILNVTPDSFSDGGRFSNTEIAIQRGHLLLEQGSDLLDIGGESTRPGSEMITVAAECERILPVIRALSAEQAFISVDTCHAETAEAAMAAGAEMINDIYALQADPDMAAVCGQTKAAVVLMNNPAWYRPKHPASARMAGHAKLVEAPEALQRTLEKLDVVEAALLFLSRSVEIALKSGISEERIVVDPGIGFGLTQEENLLLIERLDRLQSLGYPVLLAPSRKRFIRRITGDSTELCELGTTASLIWGIARGADMLRVHEPAAHLAAIKVADAILESREYKSE